MQEVSGDLARPFHLGGIDGQCRGIYLFRVKYTLRAQYVDYAQVNLFGWLSSHRGGPEQIAIGKALTGICRIHIGIYIHLGGEAPCSGCGCQQQKDADK